MIPALLSAFLLAPAPLAAQSPVFAKDNLTAWCIVPFDAKARGPVERAAMLKRLGIKRFAYDWREKDIPTFDRELDALTAEGIELTAFWFPVSMKPAEDANARLILDFLARRKARTQFWLSLRLPKDFESLRQEEKVRAASEPVAWVAAEAAKQGCKVGLYNHGGWFGEPENQVAIVKQVKASNLGIVYNFHHGHEHIARFAELLRLMLPHLMALNLNGMKEGGPKILTLGEGDRELEMLRAIRASGYRGPVGILNHRAEVDAEEGLRGNLEGLKRLLAAMGDKRALRTY